uniref:Uncharacterized protein n=1 Tax=Schistosoma haematobium TaxID=6185 RepID=A0A094ZIU4_SCHHA
MLMTALVFAIFISIGATIAIFFIQRFTHLKYLTDFLYVLLVTYAVGLLVLAIVIPASLIEAQIFCGGRAIYYRAEDFIFASMVHLFLLTFSYSGFILLFLNIKLS